MKELCNYCKEEKEVDEFKHPVTFYYLRSCTDCKNKLLTVPIYLAERKLLANIGCITIPLFIISTIILIFLSSKLGIVGIILSIIMGTISFTGVEYFIRKADKNLGIDPTKYIWCKTCNNFKKVKNWDYICTQSKELLSDSEIPCKIFSQTEKVWVSYFNLSSGDRKLYPDDCKYWSKK